ILRTSERALLPGSWPHDPVMLLRQKHMTLKVREPEDDSPLPRKPSLQRRARQLLHLAEELQAEWQEAQLLEDLEQLGSTHVLGGATAGWAVEREAQAEAEADLEKPAPRGAERSPKVKDKHRVALREPKSHQEELPRQQARRPKPQRKAVGSERQGETKPRGLGPTEKSKRKRVPSSKTSSGRQPVTPRVGRSVKPHLATGEELRGLQEKQRAWEGRRKAGKGTTVHFARGLRNISENQGPRDRLEEFQPLWPASSTHKREALAPSTPDKCIPKNRWQRELESAFEQLFNSNRKLKRHLSQHLNSRSRLDPDPQEQVFSVCVARRSQSQVLGEHPTPRALLCSGGRPRWQPTDFGAWLFVSWSSCPLRPLELRLYLMPRLALHGMTWSKLWATPCPPTEAERVRWGPGLHAWLGWPRAL
uniref:Uncharacterized protein n=1 Tax=Spermophilus dauricus TaxID=99837 RepID=A0A8C9PXM8_SPEDA